MNNATGSRCLTCGVDTARNTYCSGRCKSRAAERRRRGRPIADEPKPTTCLACGGPLAGRKHGTRCCSDACQQRVRARIKRGEEPRDPDLKPCVRCGKPVAKRHWTTARFCSKRCSENYWSLQYAKVRRPVLYRKCLVCAEDIPPEANLRRKYCSRDCRNRRQRSPEVVFQYVHARRARLVGATITPLPKKVLARIRTATCIYCGGPGGTVDHVVPLSRGGRHAEGNLVPACLPCNSSKRDKLLIEWLIHKRASTTT